jgi:hypothetical protein
MDSGKVRMKSPKAGRGGEALMTAAETVVPFVGAAKSALEGEYKKAMMEAGLDVAGGPIAKGLGAAAPMLAGIFIGPNAKTWSKRAAKEFEKLEKSSVSNEEAFKKTGTFRSPDGDLRQEISDRPSALRRERTQELDEELAVVRGRANMKADKLRQAYKDGKLTAEEAEAEWAKIQPTLKAESDALEKQRRAAGRLAMTDTKASLGKTLYHPEAFKAYPQLRELSARYQVMPSQYPEGYLKPNAWELFAQGPTTESARSTMLHEMQHGIQELEDWGKGGWPSKSAYELTDGKVSQFLRQVQQSRERLTNEFGELTAQLGENAANKSSEGQRLISDLAGADEAIDALMSGKSFPIYQRLAGEAEARAVQQRMGYGPERLREIFPLSSYDVPLDQLIVKRGYKEGGAVIMKEGGGISKNVGRGMAGLTRSRQSLDPNEIQAMMLDVPASIGVPFAEAGAEYLRGNLEDAKSSAAIDAALTAVPVVSMAAKPVARAVKRAMPVTKELLHDAFNAAQEAGLIQGPAYAIKAYHGSPHKFEKFDISKIGSGEGHQSYGHGLYFAESPKVAIGYQKRLSDATSPHTYKWEGSVYEGGVKEDPVVHALGLVYHQNKSTAQRIAKMGIKDAKRGEDYALDMGGVPYYEKMLETAKKVNRKDIKASQGNLYETNLRWPDAAREAADPLGPQHFFDYDKPLGEQAPHIKEAIEKTKSMLPESAMDDLGGDLSLLYGKDVTPNQFINTWEALAGTHAGEKMLHTAGVPGIRYLDAGSRSSGGTSNYVLFSDELAEILKRNDKQMKRGGKVEANAFPYGLRHDSELPKGKGYFGPMTTSSGDVMTEYSSSDDAGDYPLVVPTLTADEIRTLLSNGELTEQMLEKAQGWADARRKMGKSPFAGSDELRLPVPKKAGGSTTKSVKKR